jgi:hypothetical protein
VRIRYLLQVLGDRGFISRRVGRVDLHQIDEILACSIWKRPVIVSHPDGRKAEQGAKTPH